MDSGYFESKRKALTEALGIAAERNNTAAQEALRATLVLLQAYQERKCVILPAEAAMKQWRVVQDQEFWRFKELAESLAGIDTL